MEQQNDTFSAAFRLMGASLAMIWRLVYRAVKKALRRILFAMVYILSWFVHHPWMVVAVLVGIILMQQVRIMQAAVKVNDGYHELWKMQEKLDSANMTFYKLEKYGK